jgi:hypothetical protein
MGAIEITCSCGSEKTNHVRTIETANATYEHVFVCKDCNLTIVFRMIQILSVKSDPRCWV